MKTSETKQKFTIVAVDTRDPLDAFCMLSKASNAMNEPSILFTDEVGAEKVKQAGLQCEWTKITEIPPISSREEYSKFMISGIGTYFPYNETLKRGGHFLVTQCDGYPINPDKWQDKFLDYDYIGAPFCYNESIVGNGGFSLRSAYLYKVMRENPQFFRYVGDEDYVISYIFRPKLEFFGVKFAPLHIAQQFSTETGNYLRNPTKDTFGFHSREFCKKYGIPDKHYHKTDET